MRTFIALGTLLCISIGTAAADHLTPAVLGTGAPAPYGSIAGSGGQQRGGDTYNAAPLVQDGVSAFYISDAAPSTHMFDGTVEGAGNNLANPGGTFAIVEAQTPLGLTDLIQVEMIALNAAGAPAPWVTVPGFTSWRLDIGAIAAGTDAIDLGPINVVASGFTVFNSAGASLGTFGLTVDASTGSSVAGVGVVGLGGGDIAGFDLASIQLFWEVEIVPEPASLTLVLLGGLALLRRR